MSSISAIRERLERRFQRWLSHRVPRERTVLLSQRNVFIFPTAGGFVFMLLLLSLLLAGINYENNLVLALTFLMAGVFVVAVLHTYANLAGLKIRAAAADPVFAGQEAGFRLTIEDTGRRAHDALRLEWETAEPCVLRVAPGAQIHATIFLRAEARGIKVPQRLRLESRYPIGLIRAWCRPALDTRCIVYPRPGPLSALSNTDGDGEEGLSRDEAGGDDFSAFRDYRPGDALRRIAWKTLARGQALQTREFQTQSDRQRWLEWDNTAALGGVESRLSVLCRWVLELYRNDEEFGLVMPAQTIACGRGDAHRDRCLNALALFGLPDRAP